MSKSKKANSRALRDFGMVEEYYLLGCTPRTISKLTGLTVQRVEEILHGIRKKQLIIKGGE